jgi:cytochrome P450
VTGIDFIYRYAIASAENREVAFFASCLDPRNHKRHTQSKSPSYGIESQVLPSSCLTAELASGISGRLVLTADPDNIRTILSDIDAYGKGKQFHSIWRDFIGDSIFAIDGALWERTRAKMKPIFFKERVVNTSIFESHIAHLIPLLEESHGSSDLHDLFLRYTLDVATDFLFGEGTDSLIFPKSRVAKAFRNVLQTQSDLDNME